MFEQYSDRARRVVFLSLKVAGGRGAAEIGVEDLIEALVVEDQGDFMKLLSGEMAARAAAQWMAKHPPFFTAETATAIHRGLEPMLAPKGKPLADSAELPLNVALKAVLVGAWELSDELHQDSGISTHIESLHLLAAAFQDESSEVAKVLQRAGVSREAVIATIRSGESAE